MSCLKKNHFGETRQSTILSCSFAYYANLTSVRFAHMFMDHARQVIYKNCEADI